MLKLDARGKKVLFISDTHIPYSVDGYLEFLSDLKDRFKPDIVIHGGTNWITTPSLFTSRFQSFIVPVTN